MNLIKQTDVDASADDAWEVLGNQFGAIAKWSGSLAFSALEGDLGVGATRVCQGNGFGPFPAGRVSEQLTAFDPEAMTFTYVAQTGLPPFVRHAQNRWSVHARGPQQCTVRFHATVTLAWWARPVAPLLPLLLARDTRRMIEEMTYRIENGTVHPRLVAAD